MVGGLVGLQQFKNKMSAFLFDFLLPIFYRKLLLLLFVYLLVVSIKQPLSQNILFKYLLFFFGYLMVYFINDIIDLKKDLADWGRREKLLARGILSLKEYIILTFLSLISGVWLFLSYPFLGLLLFLSILLNIIRSMVRNIVIRDTFLFMIQLVSLYLLWYLLTDHLPPAVILPMFFGYAFIYSYIHYLYKIGALSLERFKDVRQLASLSFLFLIGIFILPLMSMTVYPLLILAISGLIVGLFSLYLLLYKVRDLPEIHLVAVNMLSLILLLSIITTLVFPKVVDVKVDPPIPENISHGLHKTLNEIDEVQTDVKVHVVDNITENIYDCLPSFPFKLSHSLEQNLYLSNLTTQKTVN